MKPANERFLRDALLTTEFDLPDEATTTVSSGIDLGEQPWPAIGEANLEIVVPGGVSVGAANTVGATLTVQGSTDGESYANLNPGISVTYGSGAGSSNSLPLKAQVSLHPNTPRFIRISVAGVAGIDLSAVKGVARLVF